MHHWTRNRINSSILYVSRPFLVLALEYLLSLILSQVPLFMRSTWLTETQKNMMKQTLSLELVS
jgi:hypothetical protein